jgi:subtilisin family serine protease
MDATRLTLTVLFLLLLQAGCANNGGNKVKNSILNGQTCEQDVVKDSFLVEWKDAQSVPSEFKHLRLSPQSRITRFRSITKEALEGGPLKIYGKSVASAEHEFYLRSADMTPVATTCSSTTPSWGPADALVQQAWALTGKKGDDIIVAVVDSGVDVTHSLLASQIVAGWDFTTNSPNVHDGAGHGTHVAGIIAGQTGLLNFTGVAPKAKIMPIKFIDDSGAGSVGDAISSLEFAVANGAKVINASWGGNDCSDLMKQEIQNVTIHGTVFANAAGNAGHDISDPRYFEWPAVFTVPGKITVGSMNSSQFLSIFSNYGQLVDLAAPGEKILSTVPPQLGQSDNQLCDKSGTSMATPFVAGVAALMLSNNPALSPLDIVSTINSTVTPGRYGVRTTGKLNAFKAVQAVLP